MGHANDNEKALALLFIVGAGILLLYFLSIMLFWIGVIGIIAGVIMFLLGTQSDDERLIVISIIVFLISLALLFIGLQAINFFENNEAGKTLIEGGKAMVDSGTEVVSALNEVEKTTAGALADVQSKTQDSLANSVG